MSQAIVTLLYNSDYLAGTLVLGIALRRILEARPRPDVKLGVMVDKLKLTQNQLAHLQDLYDELIEVDQLTSEMSHRLVHDLGRPELNHTLTKIQLWSLNFEKVLYLDSDTLPNVPSTGLQGSILDLLDLEFDADRILAAPDSGFPDIFNSGVFLLKPNQADYENLSALVEDSKRDHLVSFDGADQGLLNQYFNPQPDWVQDMILAGENDASKCNDFKSSKWTPLPFLYNTTPSAQYEYLPAFKYMTGTDGVVTQYGTLGKYHSNLIPHTEGTNSKVKLVHFIGPYKPWKAAKTGMYESWWNLWNSYFGDTTVEDVIRPDLGSTVQENTPVAAASHHRKFNPSELCNPANYQHIRDNIVPTADSAWDPSKESPPAPEESRHEALSQMGSFANAWDRDADAPTTTQTTTHTRDTKAAAHHPQSGHQGSHTPERVFGTNEYVPIHTLQTDPTQTTDPHPSSATDGFEYNKVYEKLRDLDLDGNEAAPEAASEAASLDDYQDENIPSPKPSLQKLFPWEFKEEKYTPERVFDY